MYDEKILGRNSGGPPAGYGSPARAGSKIVTWTEYNAHVFKDDEPAFLERCKNLACEAGIYLVFPLITIEADPAQRPAPGPSSRTNRC